MPFFQRAYNFETHGGRFRDSSRNPRHHHIFNSRRTSSHSQPPPAHEDPRRSTSLPGNFTPTLIHPDTVDSEKTIDEEAQTIRDTLGCFESLWTSLTNTLPCQIYMQLLLRLPSHYFSRVDRLSRDANLALKEILDMAVQSNSKCGSDFQAQILDLGQHSSPVITKPESLPPAYRNLTLRWGCFIDDLLEEWRTLNLVSALLVPGILTIFQVTGAANDPVTRYLAFWSLISALLSLLYGCAFIIQFSRMRKPSIAIEWAFEAQNTRSALWSVWVMLSLPVVFLAWSIVAFIFSIMAFMWRSGANPPSQFIVPPSTEFAFRIFVSAVLALGVLYGVLILVSFQRYGPTMDEALSRRIDAYIASAASTTSISPSLAMELNTPLSEHVSIFPKRSKSKSAQPKSRSGSPTRRLTSSPKTRLGVIQQSSSSAPYQPSPLSSAKPIIQEEPTVPSSTPQSLTTSPEMASDPAAAEKSEVIETQPTRPSVNYEVVGLELTQSTGSSQTMVSPASDEIEREEYTEDDDDDTANTIPRPRQPHRDMAQ